MACLCVILTVASPLGGKAVSAAGEVAAQVDPRTLLEGVIDHTRGLSSYTEMSMTIHRPDWERRSSLQAWTRGREDAYIRFTAPVRDAGNATLKDGEKMWTYTPKLNRVIRLPFSMMSQGWAGSDFSYNDLSRTDSLLREYELSMLEVSSQDGIKVYTVEARPFDWAPVVWGKEIIIFRDDHVLLEHRFYDQDMQLVKILIATDVRELGGRTFATKIRMTRLDEEDRWTELNYDEAAFDVELEDSLFTVYSLRSGRAPAPP